METQYISLDVDQVFDMFGQHPDQPEMNNISHEDWNDDSIQSYRCTAVIDGKV